MNYDYESDRTISGCPIAASLRKMTVVAEGVRGRRTPLPRGEGVRGRRTLLPREDGEGRTEEMGQTVPVPKCPTEPGDISETVPDRRKHSD